ncbi:MAG TPA: UDP-N-acetylglucosamine 2-epimerase (non-hydrolyzing), partial [Elusimicrobia bacterium]|nr:UDP-N-acetylglucosamine 2-epimerase (non-hydrolyzing) [Elusimicrobiota bacterium]
MKKIFCIFGTRPEAIKMAPVIQQLRVIGHRLQVKICVTAQHRQMLDQVLNLFGIKADYDLNIMEQKQTLTQITTNALKKLENVLKEEKPDLVLVHGDTTTTFAVTLAAYYQKMPVGHIEAGLRSYDKFNPYPEEVNRLLTDSLCDLHFAPTKNAKENLLKENIPEERLTVNGKRKTLYVTGNTVIDALFLVLKKKHQFSNPVLKKLFPNHLITQSPNHRLILVTAHRRENWGEPLENICRALKRIVQKEKNIQVIYPVHLNPAVRESVYRILDNLQNVYLTSPLDYLDFINLMKRAYLVLTDSGGLQEEAPALGKPVLVLRKVTERPEGVKAGTVKVIGAGGDYLEDKIFKETVNLLENKNAYQKMSTAVNP